MTLYPKNGKRNKSHFLEFREHSCCQKTAITFIQHAIGRVPFDILLKMSTYKRQQEIKLENNPLLSENIIHLHCGL